MQKLIQLFFMKLLFGANHKLRGYFSGRGGGFLAIVHDPLKKDFFLMDRVKGGGGGFEISRKSVHVIYTWPLL